MARGHRGDIKKGMVHKMLSQPFTSVISQGEITVGGFIVMSIVSLLLGLLVSVSAVFIGKKSRSMSITLTVIPLVVQVIIMIVNGNIGVGIGVAGAFSLIRYRSNPGTASDILLVFIAMTAGLTIGVGYIGLAVIFTVIAVAAYAVVSASGLGKTKRGLKELKITIPEGLNYPHIFDDIFEKYTNSCNLVRVRTTNMGSMYQLTYNIVLKNIDLEKEMIDDIRCRNGNLDIICGMMPELSEAERL